VVVLRNSATDGNVSLVGGGGEETLIWFECCLGFEPRAAGSRRLKTCATWCGIRLVKGLCAGEGGGD
jgi:hypothetical protein